MTRFARRVDSNQAGIVAALRAEGYTVTVTSGLGFGRPDIEVEGKCPLCQEHQFAEVEIKSSRRATLTPAQVRYRQRNPHKRLLVAVSAEDIKSGLRAWCCDPPLPGAA